MVEGARAERAAVQAVVDWLVASAPALAHLEDIVAGLCARLLACGVPLHRVALFVTTLHPDVMGRRFLWRAGEGVKVTEADYEVLDSDMYKRSPVPTVFVTGQAIRRRLAAPDCPDDYQILEELRAEGVSDYLIQALPFTGARSMR